MKGMRKRSGTRKWEIREMPKYATPEKENQALRRELA
jgi:hypothetical protein